MDPLIWALTFRLKMSTTRLAHNFLNIDPFLTRPVPIESSHSQLSIGTSLVKNGSISRELRSNRNSITFTMCNCPVTYSYVRYISEITTTLSRLDNNRFPPYGALLGLEYPTLAALWRIRSLVKMSRQCWMRLGAKRVSSHHLPRNYQHAPLQI